jgi:hypothetical protein
MYVYYMVVIRTQIMRANRIAQVWKDKSFYRTHALGKRRPVNIGVDVPVAGGRRSHGPICVCPRRGKGAAQLAVSDELGGSAGAAARGGGAVEARGAAAEVVQALVRSARDVLIAARYGDAHAHAAAAGVIPC